MSSVDLSSILIVQVSFILSKNLWRDPKDFSYILDFLFCSPYKLLLILLALGVCGDCGIVEFGKRSSFCLVATQVM